MFPFKKKIKSPESTEPLRVSPSENVKCEICKHLISRYDAQIIKSANYIYSNFYWPEGPSERHYCPEHKRPYERTEVYREKEIFFKEFQVSEDGTPIGYKKIPQKKS